MMITKADGKTVNSEVTGTITFNGNWNYKAADKTPVLSKPLGISYIGDYNIVFSHKDLFELLELYYWADLFAVRMINCSKVDTGVVSKSEKVFLDKVMDWINNKKSGGDSVRV